MACRYTFRRASATKCWNTAYAAERAKLAKMAAPNPGWRSPGAAPPPETAGRGKSPGEAS
jgi:hypothetical protein